MSPLYLANPLKHCGRCKNARKRRRKCEACHQTGYAELDLGNWWRGRAVFLLGGGPSLARMPYQRLSERGVASFGVNNVAGFAPVSAWCFSDPQTKFHHGLFFDPRVITFCPTPKLGKHVRVKLPDDTFRVTTVRVGDCPATVGYSRSGRFHPERFLSDWFAHWGYGGKQNGPVPFSRLATFFCGLRLVCHLGARRIYLAGVDLRKDSQRPGDAYCFNERGSGGSRMLAKENQMCHAIRPVLEAAGIEVFNCNPESACDAFEFRSFDAAIEDCKGAVPDEPFDLSQWYAKGIERTMRELYPEQVSEQDVAALQR